MKLKQLPHDFIVEELPSISISKEEKTHSIFIMEKISITTLDAIRILSKKINIPLFEIGYAGLKDKHVVTRQYISVPTQYSIKFQNTDKLKLYFAGYHDKKIHIGNLKGNRFSIIVRNITGNQLKDLPKRAKTIKQYGVLNYFDSQRFGSVIENEFIAKYILKKNYEKAVKVYLTKYQSSEPRWVKNDKRRICEHWDNLQTISIHTWEFKKVIDEYLKTKSWLAAYKKIPAILREIFIKAYQSFIWNECIKEVVRVRINKKKIFTITYNIGSLLFYTDLTEEERKLIPSVFKTVSHDGIYSEFEKQIIDKILLKQGVMLADFTIESLTGNFFKTHDRKTLVKPNDFSVSEPMKDTINSSYDMPRYAIETSFSLSKGSYATIITKQLFNN